MLDGILGRGFSAKCKSLMKTTRSRIDVVRRRAEAKQRFLNEDLAKLLSNGLDINAYGRTEEFIAGMNLLWSYKFVEQSCEYIGKQLSRMQKEGECPEECREAVASLMYAAARFSDLPELRELRDIFQQRYGSCMEAFVNQKLIEKLSTRPPSKEKRLQVLQDIASEFSIRWDSRGFERRMATPTIVAQVDGQRVEVVKQRQGPLVEKSRVRSYEGNIQKREEGDNHISRRKEAIEYKEKSLLKNGGSSSQGDDDLLYCGRRVFTESKHSYPIEKDLNVGRSNISSHGKVQDNIVHTRHSNGIRNPRIGESTEGLPREKADVAPSSFQHSGKTRSPVFSHDSLNQDNTLSSIKKGVDERSDRLKGALPPPYIKSNQNISRPPPYVKPEEDKHKISRDSKHAVPHNEADRHNYEEQSVAPAKVRSYGHEKELDYPNDKFPLPKPRSLRRKHHKSSSSHRVDAVEDVKRSSSSSRRKDLSKKGLQILFEEEHHVKDDEERMIDKLLIHYSKKPSNFDAGNLRKKSREGESSLDQSRHGPARSVSLPNEHAGSPDSNKIFARSNTFQEDNQARHVHPKLPNYDDLAARFAALKGR
ncbi:hypothetical protein ACS0TY_026887 [Phlomoides rotata]